MLEIGPVRVHDIRVLFVKATQGVHLLGVLSRGVVGLRGLVGAVVGRRKGEVLRVAVAAPLPKVSRRKL